MTNRTIGLVAAVAFAAGCGGDGALSEHLQATTVRALEAPDRIELLVLGERLENRDDGFDGREVLATLEVDASAAPELRSRMAAALEGAETVAACYEPHHGLRIHRADDVAELSICFHCSQMNEFGQVPYHVIADRRERGLRAQLDALIEAETRYRFDEDAGFMGGWVER